MIDSLLESNPTLDQIVEELEAEASSKRPRHSILVRLTNKYHSLHRRATMRGTSCVESEF